MSETKDHQAAFEQLLLVNSCLTNAERLQRYDGDDESINKLSLWIAQAMLPDGGLILNDASAEGPCGPSPSACARAKLSQIHCQRSARKPFISHATKDFLACHLYSISLKFLPRKLQASQTSRSSFPSLHSRPHVIPGLHPVPEILHKIYYLPLSRKLILKNSSLMMLFSHSFDRSSQNPDQKRSRLVAERQCQHLPRPDDTI